MKCSECKRLNDLLVTAALAPDPDTLTQARDMGQRHALPGVTWASVTRFQASSLGVVCQVILVPENSQEISIGNGRMAEQHAEAKLAA
jgi:hypothetical protein